MKFLLVIFMVCLFFSIYGQSNIDVKEKIPVNYSGSLTLSHQHYNQHGGSAGLIPSNSFNISGGVTLSIKGVDLPVSVVYNTGSFKFVRPILYLGTSPKFRKTTFHIGMRAMNFSKYFLSGTTFLGLGVETSYKKLRFSAMGGRLRNFFAYDPDVFVDGLSFLQDYNRNIITGKIGFGTKRAFFDLLAFKGEDRFSEAALNAESMENIELHPKENVGLGIDLQVPFHKNLFFKMEALGSAYSENKDKSDFEIDEQYQSYTNIFSPNLTSSFSYAGTASMSFQVSRWNLSYSTELVGPEFRTIGTYYYQSDFINHSLSTSFKLMEGKIRFGGSFGYMKNKLSDRNINSNLRKTYAVNFKYKPNKKLLLTGKYSNFNFDKSPQIEQFDDTLKVVSIQQNGYFSPMMKFGKENNSSIRLILNYRLLDNKFALERLSSESQVYMTKVVVGTTLYDYKLRAGGGWRIYDYPEVDRETYTIDLSVSKSFLKKKLSARVGSSYNKTNVLDKNNGYFLRSFASANMNVNKFSSLQLAVSHLSRKQNVGQDRSEIRIRTALNLRI